MNDNYQKEQAARAEKFHTLAKAIATALDALGLGASYVEPAGEQHFHNCADIALKGGRGIHIGSIYRTERIEVSGDWPKTAKGETYSASYYSDSEYTRISISMKRTPEAIAKDIARRFLPGYLAEYSKQAERAKNADTYASDTQETLRLAAAAAGRTPLPSGSRHNEAGLTLCLGETYCDLEASAQTVTLKLRSLSREHAQAVLKLVASLNK